MRVIERISLLDRIGRELQSKMSYSDISVYLGAYGIDCKDFQPSSNSKWIYVKELLANADESLLIKIADDLEIEHNYTSATPKESTVWKAGQFKLFLSHLASFKVQTARLQQVLKKYAISSFVAHEDIEPAKNGKPKLRQHCILWMQWQHCLCQDSRKAIGVTKKLVLLSGVMY